MTINFTKPPLQNYNDNAPSDDGQGVASNEVKYQKIVDELSDPLMININELALAIELAFTQANVDIAGSGTGGVAYTQTEKDKLATIQSGAKDDQTKADIDPLGINATSLGGQPPTYYSVAHLHPYETSFSKNTAFNKNFGTTAGTVSQGDHTHPSTGGKFMITHQADKPVGNIWEYRVPAGTLNNITLTKSQFHQTQVDFYKNGVPIHSDGSWGGQLKTVTVFTGPGPVFAAGDMLGIKLTAGGSKFGVTAEFDI